MLSSECIQLPWHTKWPALVTLHLYNIIVYSFTAQFQDFRCHKCAREFKRTNKGETTQKERIHIPPCIRLKGMSALVPPIVTYEREIERERERAREIEKYKNKDQPQCKVHKELS